MTNEQRYYDALRRIAKDYLSSEEIAREAKKEYGLTPHEAIEMAYDNVRMEAIEAIKGRKRPQ